jgi:DNA polymerase III gamma/tau subunit
MPPMNLADKYRPRVLSEIVGQPWAVEQLQVFVRSPAPTAFLFEGETGTGKTSAALALAADLGVDTAAGPLGGLHQIASGEQTGESVRRVMDGLRLYTLSGSGWKVLVVNEADCMTANAAHVWLDALDRLPPRAVVVFTTNHADRLPARLRDRCERLRFESGYLALAPYMPELIARVWKGEGGKSKPPALDELGALQDAAGNLSIRRVIQALAPCLRAGTRPARPAKPVEPVEVQTLRRQLAAVQAINVRLTRERGLIGT